MTSYDSLNDFDDAAFDLPDSSEYQAQAKYSYQKGKLQKPRRNRSAFIIFSSETRAKLKLDEGNLNSNEMMVKLAELWKNLSNEERDRYENLAKEDRLRYQQELIEFTKFNPNETIHNKTKNNHVKKPCSAYGIFLKERKDVIKNQHPDYKMADVLKIVSQEWKNLPEDQKQMYQNKATMEKEVIQTKISEALARDQVAQESLQPKNKKQVKRNGSDEAYETNTQSDMTPMLKHNNSSFSSQQSWPRVGESLYIPIQPHVGLPEDYLKMEHSPSMDTIRSLSHHSSSNFESVMNQYANHQVSNGCGYYNPAMNQMNQMNPMNQMNQAHMANAMMANYMNMGNMGMTYDRMSSTQTNPESYNVGTHTQYQPQPIQKSISQQSSGSQQHIINQPVHQHVNQSAVNRHVTQQPNQQINVIAAAPVVAPVQRQVTQPQPQPQLQPQVQQQVVSQPPKASSHQVLNVDMNLFNKYMDNFASSDFLLDDGLFEKGDF